MKIILPRVFAPLQNNVPLSYLDDNFNALNNLFTNMGFQYFYNIDQYTDLTAAVAAIGAIPSTLFINVGTSITANTTIPVTLRLWFLYPGTINQSTFTLTINSMNNRVNYNPLLGTGTVTGLFVEVAGTSAPASGYWPAGSRCWNSVPTVAQPKSWVCTVAGSPGTWVSEGNL